MKRRLLLLLPLLVFLGMGFFLYRGLGMDPSARDSALLAQKFPAFSLSTLKDPSRHVDESLLEGEITLVNVWAEWCPTCKEEMPQLLTLAERGVRLVGINYKDTRAKGQEFLDEFGDPFEVNIFDPDGDLGFELGVYGVPETFLVDTKSIIRYKHTGYITPGDVEQVMKEVEKWQ
ncbi:cytochrome c biogenesis protein CcmG, thiol:disulfide interchange protein DsbE [Modicisalibacter ilicicola DSM 19980]|uniref:Cytochrome c biogenesis protein CcmG, thiol:disulfide interchange protein DsbE n=1 Tax=Modicisalibacter ilicicola DSM 19980 TaxID=1121942 RepID=A0A1M5CYP6_9GAMM|nr:DsbE family thiol:disulfide interchange protein [Halomonas ilicicola]SHF59764.1 cytochrome c biogenesis protein CcmG, thiol:disulfide interchange protein DsbE [Halomonas ilicicola DSM 19980]